MREEIKQLKNSITRYKENSSHSVIFSSIILNLLYSLSKATPELFCEVKSAISIEETQKIQSMLATNSTLHIQDNRSKYETAFAFTKLLENQINLHIGHVLVEVKEAFGNNNIQKLVEALGSFTVDKWSLRKFSAVFTTVDIQKMIDLIDAVELENLSKQDQRFYVLAKVQASLLKANVHPAIRPVDLPLELLLEILKKLDEKTLATVRQVHSSLKQVVDKFNLLPSVSNYSKFRYDSNPFGLFRRILSINKRTLYSSDEELHHVKHIFPLKNNRILGVTSDEILLWENQVVISSVSLTHDDFDYPSHERSYQVVELNSDDIALIVNKKIIHIYDAQLKVEKNSLSAKSGYLHILRNGIILSINIASNKSENLLTIANIETKEVLQIHTFNEQFYLQNCFELTTNQLILHFERKYYAYTTRHLFNIILHVSFDFSNFNKNSLSSSVLDNYELFLTDQKILTYDKIKRNKVVITVDDIFKLKVFPSSRKSFSVKNDGFSELSNCCSRSNVIIFAINASNVLGSKWSNIHIFSLKNGAYECTNKFEYSSHTCSLATMTNGDILSAHEDGTFNVWEFETFSKNDNNNNEPSVNENVSEDTCKLQ